MREELTDRFGHPPLEVERLYALIALRLRCTALGIESIEKDVETIEDGEYVTPEPFANLQLAVRVAQMAYLRDRDLGAPEEVLESLRQYSVQAAELFSRAAAPANDNAAMPMDPGQPVPGQPVAALAPEAMNLMAG